MRLANPTYLQNTPDLKAMLLTMSALTAVALPLLWQLPVGVVGVFLSFLALRFGLLFLGIWSLKSWQILLLMLGMAVLVRQQLGTLVGLGGGAAFLLMLSLLKSYEGKTRRDWQVLIVAMMFVLAAGILFDQGLLVGLWTLVCLVLMAMSLAVLNELDFQAALKNSLQVFLLALLPMVVLFVAMPRRETPFWGVPQLKNEKQATTGMSEMMKPGSISDLVESNEPVFSATFDNGYVPQQKDLYWRVMILAQHDGEAWQAMRDVNDEAVAQSKQAIAYQVMLEDDKGRIPALDYPIDVSQQRGLRREAGDMVRVFSRAGVRRIRLQSAISDVLPHALSPFWQQRYTRLPENLNPRTRALAQQLWQQSGQNPETFAAMAYAYFQTKSFAYTLKPPLLSSPNTTDEFLFNSKMGFCEHYADAFVVLMRSAGVAARVVVGYQGGEYNEEGGFWQIRSKDAHAWAEIWLPEKQVWKRIDPTSAVAANRIDGSIDQALSNDASGSALKSNTFTQAIDQGRYYWQTWIVDYDSGRQQNLFAHFGLEGVGKSLLMFILLLGLGLACLPVWWWWRQSRSQDIQPLEHGFMILKQNLLGKNHQTIQSIAPNELREYLREQNRLPEDIAHLLDDYIRLRYAQSHAPSRSQQKSWQKHALKFAKKYRVKDEMA